MKANHFCLVLAILAYGAARSASVPQQTTVPKSSAAQTTIEVSSRQPVQGNLLRVTVKSEAPLSTVTGEWAGHQVSFWRDNESGTVFRAFLGVDLDQHTGEQDLKVSLQPIAGAATSSLVKIDVRTGHYAIEKLTVASAFVEPPAAEAERIKQEGERMRAILTASTNEKLWSQAFRFPLDGPRRGGNFGKRRVYNGEARSPHSGLDIPAPTGTPVHATNSGRIALAEPLYFSGNTIVIDHGLGLYSFYGHLSEIRVKQGDAVAAGALIGLVGATGRVTGPHLHWGLIVNDAKVNPLQILPPEPKQN